MIGKADIKAPQAEINNTIMQPGDALLSAKGMEKVVVHTMPKRFYKNEPKAQEAKSIGLLILAGGLIVIAAVLVTAYFMFFKKDGLTDRASVDAYVINTNIDKAADQVRSEEKTIGTEETTEKPFANDVLETATTTAETATTTAETATTTAETATTTAEIIDTSIKTAPDSDQDGLSDLEEIILDTNPLKEDSDGDGYSDSSELLNLYNPAGGGKIIANPNIKKYSNSKYSYTLYHPEIWPISNIGGEESVMFQLDSNQFIQIIIQANPKKIPIEDWYMEQFDVDSIAAAQRIYKKGWNGVSNDDAMVVYLTNPVSDKIFTVTYNLGINYTLNYKSIFKMMIQSLEIYN